MQSIPYYHVDVFTNKPLSGNGLIVFPTINNLSKSDMQKLTREMRQFESIFLEVITNDHIRAFVFTCEEELDFAGHPVLGAAATLHGVSHPNEPTREWIFELNKKQVSVITTRESGSFNAVMNQGIAEFGKRLDDGETKIVLDCINLQEDDLYPGHLPMVVSTGLPYLLIPLIKNASVAKIKVDDLELRLKSFDSKFLGLLEIPSLNIRTWDNFGVVEDVATGSLAGPCGAYLFKHELLASNTVVQLNQGENLGRPSQLFVELRTGPGKNFEVYVGGTVCQVAHGVLDEQLKKALSF